MITTTQRVEQTPSVDEQRLLVGRILSSKLFCKSHRLASFLRFICEEHQQGRGHTLQEHRIGTVVFGRPETYHMGEDSIVRSQARFLRLRLQEYFETEGKDEPIVLTVPKGSYVPEFHFRERSTQPAPFALATSPVVPADEVGVVPVQRVPRPGISRAVLAALAIALVCAAVVIVWRLAGRDGTAAVTKQERQFWTSIFDPKRSTLIVPADSSLVLMDELIGTEIQLPDYTTRRYRSFKPSPELEHLWSTLVQSQYTNVADLRIVSQLQRLPQVDRTKTQIRFARDLSVSEIKQNNVVLIGSARANPWVDLFQEYGRFRVGYDPLAKLNIVQNRDPGPGEKPLYVEVGGDTSEHVAYGVISYLPSLDGESSSLLVGGTSKAGTEAAAEYLLGPDFPKFLNTLAQREAVPHFELLLSARNLNGSSYQSTIICYHRLANAGGR